MAEQTSNESDKLQTYYDLREKYAERFNDSFPSFKYGNDVDNCIEALRECLRKGRPEKIDEGLVY